MCICRDCIYEEREYQEALEKAKINNPFLFEEQKRVNEKKRRCKLLLNLVRYLVYGLAIIAVIFALTAGILQAPVLLIVSVFIIFVMSLVMIVSLKIEDRFWDRMANMDYRLYSQQKLEFAKVGYQLP